MRRLYEILLWLVYRAGFFQWSSKIILGDFAEVTIFADFILHGYVFVPSSVSCDDWI